MGVTTLAGLALAAAGTGMSIAANQATTSAENQAITDQLALQQKYTKESTDVFNQSLAAGTVTKANEQIASGQEKYKGEYAKADTVPVAAGPSETTQASRVLGDQTAAANTASNAARAQLGGYTEWDINQWIKNLDAQQTINLINTKARAQESVLPYKLYDAQNSQNNLRSWGSIISALGSVAGAMGGGAAEYSQIPAQTSQTLQNQQKGQKALSTLISEYGPTTNSSTQNMYMPYDWSANPLNT